jgi:hypothetical protein
VESGVSGWSGVAEERSEISALSSVYRPRCQSIDFLSNLFDYDSFLILQDLQDLRSGSKKMESQIVFGAVMLSKDSSERIDLKLFL